MMSAHDDNWGYALNQRWKKAIPVLPILMLVNVLPHLTAQQTFPVLAAQHTRHAVFQKKVDHPKFVPRGPASKVFNKQRLPTMDPAVYTQLKLAAASGGHGTKSAAPSKTPVPLDLTTSFPGLDRFGSADQGFIYTPPDVNTAVGLGQIAEVTNNAYAVYDTSGNQLQSIPMSVFFGYTGQLLTDPRVLYDSVWNRWIVTEVGNSENATTQFFFFAVSLTADATGSFFVYAFNMPLAANDFYDYPQAGYDQDALIFTFNVFNGQPFKYAEIDVAPKARVYNGLAFSMPFINGFPGTLTPNIVRDNNGTTTVIRNAPGTNVVELFKLTNTSRNNFAVAGPVDVTTLSYNVPPSAHQPGTTATLDTLDTRFQAPGTQAGSILYQVHDINDVGFPTPHVVQIDIDTNTLVKEDLIFASGSSDDFNPSLAANDLGDVFVNWSSTDSSVGLNAGTVYSSQPSGSFFGPVGLCFRSTTPYSGFRWGDTSGASLDPTDPTQKQFWLSNETIEDTSNWGTQVCSVGI